MALAIHYHGLRSRDLGSAHAADPLGGLWCRLRCLGSRAVLAFGVSCRFGVSRWLLGFWRWLFRSRALFWRCFGDESIGGAARCVSECSGVVSVGYYVPPTLLVDHELKHISTRIGPSRYGCACSYAPLCPLVFCESQCLHHRYSYAYCKDTQPVSHAHVVKGAHCLVGSGVESTAKLWSCGCTLCGRPCI